MNHVLRAAIATAAFAALAAPLHAQDWTGGYVGGHLGEAGDPDDNGNDRFLFDTNLDGNFNDSVNTAAGANAFSPGFCNGAAQTAQPAGGCSANEGGADWGLRAGYDWQSGSFVFGLVGEYAMNDVRDAVSAFSTTPAYYTMYRKVDGMFAVRGRAGFAFGDGEDNLLYATAGYAYAKVENSFGTSNRANAFADNGNDNVDGLQYGVGYERRFDQFTVGLEYLLTQLDDDGYRVDVTRGNAPATNPFLIVNPDGTQLRRSDTDFDFDSLRLTATYRF